ncbi:MAG: peptidase domain-containing ABC transporter [Bacteroidales bacterium]|nr:peptidase domain-containing ABC transporter [Bacteroidales bacterium]
MRSILNIKQTDSYDCGAASLASVAGWWGVYLPLSRFRRECGCSKEGVTIQGIIDGARAVGLSAKALKVEEKEKLSKEEKINRLRSLNVLKAPVILHITSDKGMLHFVVMTKCVGKRIHIMDPAKGRIEKRLIGEFAQQWSGYVILCSPGEGFAKRDEAEGRFGRIIKLLKFHKREVILSLAGSVALSAVGVCNSLLLQLLIDDVIPSGNRSLLVIISAAILALMPLSLAVSYIRNLYMISCGVALDTRLNTGFMRRILSMDARFFRDYPKGELESRLSDSYKIRALVNEGTVQAGVCITTLLIVLILLFTFYQKLALFLILTIPAYIVMLILSHRANKKISKKIMSSASLYEADIIDTIEGADQIRHFNIDPSTLRYNGSYATLALESYRAGKISSALQLMGSGISQLIMAVILIGGGTAVLYSKMSVGELVSFFTLSTFFISPLNELLQLNSALNEALTASDRVYDITSSQPVYEGIVTDSVKNKVNQRGLELQNVSFRYPGRETLIENFSCSLPNGSITAIYGASGSGKSTLVSLFMRDWKPTEGKILYGGIDIYFYNPTSWRKIISAAPQYSHLFNATILENITMELGSSHKEIDDESLRKIASISEQIGMEKMINRLQSGIMTQVGKGGVQLSGGETQKVLLARALYRNPKILILDETTSFMDSESRLKVYDTLQKLKQTGCCIVLISHNRDTLSIADRAIELCNKKTGQLTKAESGAPILPEPKS